MANQPRRNKFTFHILQFTSALMNFERIEFEQLKADECTERQHSCLTSQVHRQQRKSIQRNHSLYLFDQNLRFDSAEAQLHRSLDLNYPRVRLSFNLVFIRIQYSMSSTMDRMLRKDHDRTEGNRTSLKMQDSKPNKKQTTTEEDHLHLTLRLVHTKPKSNHQTQLNLNDVLPIFVHTFTVDR
jgi:hypothetical protein